MTKQLLSNTLVVPAVIANIGTVGAMTAVEVDGRGYSRACFIFQLGTATATGLLDAKIQNATTTGGSFGDVTSAALTQVTKAAGDGKVEIIDIPVSGAKPFMKVVGSTSTAAFPHACVCILYNGVKNPPTQTAGQNVAV